MDLLVELQDNDAKEYEKRKGKKSAQIDALKMCYLLLNQII